MFELTKNQKKTIELLANSLLKEKFYWTGGTLLAYHYFHHRFSEDLDFFTEKPFNFEEINPLVNQIKKECGFKKVNFKKVFERYEFFFKNKEPLRIEFVYYNSEKKTLKKRKKLLGVYIDSLEDLSANKTMAYFDRNEPKDLFDLYFILKKGKFSPKKLLKLTEKKFGVVFSQDSFWSESFKRIKNLSQIKPLIIAENERDKDKLLEKIKECFQQNSNKYLSNFII